jgi:2-polyprenyl-3-methyl-5-hydroxy-6-metoxy-1,4-benzoquinol methylase
MTPVRNHLERSQCKAIARYYGSGAKRQYVRWKLACDPVYSAVDELLVDTALPLLDVGCGIGLLGQYLHKLGRLPSYVGLDHDLRKISAARLATQSAGLQQKMQFHPSDVASLPSIHGNVALLDVLHYLSAPGQQVMLAAALQHLAPTGRLIIRNVLREPNWRFHATRVEEFFLHRSGWIPGGAQHYPTASELRMPLENAGLDVRITSLRGRTPFNSYLIVAQRHD